MLRYRATFPHTAGIQEPFLIEEPEVSEAPYGHIYNTLNMWITTQHWSNDNVASMQSCCRNSKVLVDLSEF